MSPKKINFAVAKANATSLGVMLEWLKRQTWKVCIPRKGIGSSNLPHSAKKSGNSSDELPLFFGY